ncbi:MAG: PQQ-binding-like beta-propeller repeat protein [Caldilineaceae bacterium]
MNEQFPLAVAQQRPLHRASPKGGVIALILFAVLLILFAFTAAPAASQSDSVPKIYWTDSGGAQPAKIARANLDGMIFEELIVSQFDPTDIAVDPTTGKVYWTNRVTKKIHRADSDGANIEELIGSGLSAPVGIALDVAGGKMYWADSGAGKIQRANLDGTNVRELVASGLSSPNGIALDVADNKMYWTDSSAGKIQRANLDGTDIQDVITGTFLFPPPNGITLDILAKKIYWTEGSNSIPGSIRRANLDGTNAETLVGAGVLGPCPPLKNCLPAIQYIVLQQVQLDVAAGKMYWIEDDRDARIHRANLDGTNREVLITTSFITGIALDTTRSKIYWTNSVTNKIQSANLDGSNIQDFIPTDLLQPNSIALDTENSKMYWTDAGTQKIQRANLDRTGLQDIVIFTPPAPNNSIFDVSPSPNDIALDVAANKMYWVDSGTDKIQRANLDGSNVQDLITNTLTNPEGIALNVAAGKMYWTDSGTDKIQRANLDGTNIQDLITDTLSGPRGIELDIAANKMYWTDWGTRKIQRANLDGSNIQDLITKTLSSPNGIALDVGAGKMYWTDSGTDKIQRANLDGTDIEDVVIDGLDNPQYIALALSLPNTPTPISTPLPPATHTPTPTSTLPPSVTQTPSPASHQIYLSLIEKANPSPTPTVTPPRQPEWTFLGGATLDISSLAIHGAQGQLFLGVRNPLGEGGGIYRESITTCEPFAFADRVWPNAPVYDLAFAGDRALAGTEDAEVLLSVDGGNTWRKTQSQIEHQISAVEIVNGKLYAASLDDSGEGSLNGVFVSADNGNNWRQIPGSPKSVNRLRPHNESIWVASSACPWRVDTQNDTVNNVCGNLPDNEASRSIWDIAVAQTGATIFLATTNGIYRGDGNGQWEPFGLPNIHVRSLHIVDNSLYAGTETGGVTSSSVASPSWTPIEQFAGSKIRDLLYDAQFCQGLFAATAKGVFLFR